MRNYITLALLLVIPSCATTTNLARDLVGDSVPYGAVVCDAPRETIDLIVDLYREASDDKAAEVILKGNNCKYVTELEDGVYQIKNFGKVETIRYKGYDYPTEYWITFETIIEGTTKMGFIGITTD